MRLQYATTVRPYTDGFGFGCCLPLNSIQSGFPAAPRVTSRSQQLIRDCPAITRTSCTFPAARHFGTRLFITPILAERIFDTGPKTFYSSSSLLRCNDREAILINLPAHTPVPLSIRFAASQYLSNSSSGVVFISGTFASTYSNRSRKRRLAILRASSGFM